MNTVMSVAAHFHHTRRPTLFDTVTILSVPLILPEVFGHPSQEESRKKERQSIAALPWEEGD
jgi:hypothetical protein